MELLLKELKKKFNLSASEISDFEDLERCVMGLAFVGSSQKNASSAMKKVLEFIDAHSFARVVMEDTEVFAIE